MAIFWQTALISEFSLGGWADKQGSAEADFMISNPKRDHSGRVFFILNYKQKYTYNYQQGFSLLHQNNFLDICNCSG
jgi:hypothetical protein